MVSVVIERAFEEGAAPRPRRGRREQPANTILQEMRRRAVIELFGGNEAVFEWAFTAAAQVERERFMTNKIPLKEVPEEFVDALTGILIGWFDQSHRDHDEFVERLMKLV